MKMKRTVMCFLELLMCSFFLNFFWESLHGFSLYKDHLMDSDKYVRMMVYMSFMDALTIGGIYVFLAVIHRDIFWLKNMRKTELLLFAVTGLVVGAAAEYWAVYVTHQWHYNSYMPTILGIGISPLLQLSATGIISLWLVRKCNAW